MDVSTRWDSTGTMMIRAQRLRPAIDRFCIKYPAARPYMLSELDWKQIGYLIDLVRPFAFFTATMGRTKSITLPYALQVYDEMFERLVECRRRLIPKVARKPWVQKLIDGIDSAEDKLMKYYNKTYTNLGSVYAIGAILNPGQKLDAFDEKYCWLDFKKKNWKFEFEDHLHTLYRQNYSTTNCSNAAQLEALRQVNADPLAIMLDRSRQLRYQEDNSATLFARISSGSEVDKYLAMRKPFRLFSLSSNLYTNLCFFTAKDPRAILVAWKDLQYQVPGMARMAKDLLAIPMTSLGPERCFNFAGDMCHYRRGQLHNDTVTAIMLSYYALLVEKRIDQLKAALDATINIQDMTEEEMEKEMIARTYELDITRSKVDDWDHDHYISDEEPQGRHGNRTRLVQERKEYRERLNRRQENRRAALNQPKELQALSTFDKEQIERRRRQGAEQDARSRANPAIFDGPFDPTVLPSIETLRQRTYRQPSRRPITPDNPTDSTTNQRTSGRSSSKNYSKDRVLATVSPDPNSSDGLYNATPPARDFSDGRRTPITQRSSPPSFPRYEHQKRSVPGPSTQAKLPSHRPTSSRTSYIPGYHSSKRKAINALDNALSHKLARK